MSSIYVYQLSRCFWIVSFSAPRPRLDMEQPWSVAGPCRSWQALPCPPPPPCPPALLLLTQLCSAHHPVYFTVRCHHAERPGAPHRALPSHPPPSGTRQLEPPGRFTGTALHSSTSSNFFKNITLANNCHLKNLNSTKNCT